MENYELYKWFISQSPIMQALYAGLFTWGLTALGAALVFLFKSSNRKVLDTALGFTGGVMIAASFWSLLSPAISYVEMQNEYGLSSMPPFLPPAIGFFLGALFQSARTALLLPEPLGQLVYLKLPSPRLSFQSFLPYRQT